MECKLFFIEGMQTFGDYGCAKKNDPPFYLSIFKMVIMNSNHLLNTLKVEIQYNLIEPVTRCDHTRLTWFVGYHTQS